MLRAFLIFLLWANTAAAQNILMIGDSILDWNRGTNQSVSDYLEQELGTNVVNKSVSGAHFSAQGALAKALRLDIRGQNEPGDWDIVILDGGGNDLGNECWCRQCDETISEMISDDGKNGSIPTFLRKLTGNGHRVIWLDYYRAPSNSDFAPCTKAFEAFSKRLKKLQMAQVTIADAKSVYDPTDLSLFDDDLVHPSPKGAKRLATLLADVIRP